jgi:hypothetical protein
MGFFFIAAAGRGGDHGERRSAAAAAAAAAEKRTGKSSAAQHESCCPRQRTRRRLVHARQVDVVGIARLRLGIPQLLRLRCEVNRHDAWENSPQATDSAPTVALEAADASSCGLPSARPQRQRQQGSGRIPPALASRAFALLLAHRIRSPRPPSSRPCRSPCPPTTAPRQPWTRTTQRALRTGSPAAARGPPPAPSRSCPTACASRRTRSPSCLPAHFGRAARPSRPARGATTSTRRALLRDRGVNESIAPAQRAVSENPPLPITPAAAAGSCRDAALRAERGRGPGRVRAEGIYIAGPDRSYTAGGP